MALWAIPTAVVSLFPWWAVSAFLAQETNSPESSTVAALATLLVQLGLSGVFLWQWRQERTERQEKDALVVQILQQAIPALEKSTDTLEAVQRGLSVQVERVAPRQEQIGRVEQLLDQLRKALDGDAGGGGSNAISP